MRWITALNLETWARSLNARVDLPKLVSDLIRASSTDLTSIRFPSGDKGQVRGFDGYLESETAALNVPLGNSYWEFGTNQDYQAKALSDFKKRTVETTDVVRHETTFVFVSPWTWDSSDPTNKLEDFVAARSAEGQWKDVRYIDGVGLEHWLEQNPAVAAWHARNTLKVYPIPGVKSTDELWADFGARFQPPLTEEVLLCGRAKAATQLVADLAVDGSTIRLVADSPDEALAFAVAAIRRSPSATRLYLEARTLVVDQTEAGRQLPLDRRLILLLRGEAARAPSQFGAAATNFVPLGRQHRGPSVPELERPGSHELGEALRTMGFEENRAITLAQGCGRSLVALARLIPGGSVEPPAWESDARALLPAILAGAWDAQNDLDRDVLGMLAGHATAREIQQKARARMLDSEPPFDMEGSVWKVRAPMDAFIRIGPIIDEEDVERLKQAALKVFSQVDPRPDPNAVVGIETDNSERHSDWLRDGLATTILLLAVWSDIAKVRLGHQSGKRFADDLIRSIPGLSNNPRLLTSLRDELPLLAEAAPDPLLAALEQLLGGDGSAMLPLFDEKPAFIHSVSEHHGVVHALEVLAWDPTYFRRAVLALAKLASIDPGGKVGPRPASSLYEILILWNPGTNASAQERMAVLDEILSEYPEIGWQLLLSLLPSQHASSTPTAKPRLREPGAADRPPVTYQDLWDNQAAICRRAITTAGFEPSRWLLLIPRLSLFPDAERKSAIQGLADTMQLLHPSGRNDVWDCLKKELSWNERFGSGKRALQQDDLAVLQQLADRFSPTDPVRVAAAEIETAQVDADFDVNLVTGRVSEILGGLFAREGADGVVRLSKAVKAPWLLGMALDQSGLGPDDLQSLLNSSFADDPQSTFTKSAAGAYRRSVGAKVAWAWLDAMKREGALNGRDLSGLLQAWPDERHTWWLARNAGPETYASFWISPGIHGTHLSRFALIEASIHLLRNGEAQQALGSVTVRPEAFPTRLITALLDGLITQINRPGTMPDQMTGYYVEKALDVLDARSDISAGQVAAYELRLYPLLEHGERHLRLFATIADDPELFHSLLREVFRGDDDPLVEINEIEPAVQARARRSWSILNKFDRLPGLSADGLNARLLREWTEKVLELGQQTKRAAITASYIGRVFAHAPADGLDGVWPDRGVRDLIEHLASQELENGLQVERFNMRGVHTRSLYDGGNQEREMAKTAYEGATVIAAGWPRSAAVLRNIGDTWSATAEHADVDAAQRRLRY